MGRGVGSKDRAYADFSPRFVERERRSGWGVAPPSRKLWVGNLSSHITESILSEQFLRFGDIESIAYLPGKSYAYVKFKKEEDAVLALRTLHGSNVAGMPLRIEFAKGDEAYYLQKEARKAMERGESRGELPSRRELRNQKFSPEKSSDKSNKSYKSAEPSEVLWIGFPSALNVDEIILRRAFSPFGEIEKITSFPGRSYAFVRYRSVVAACRAKEALHGKLFNNPRVNICFARSDAPAEHGKAPSNGPFPSHLKTNFLPGPSGKALEPLRDEEDFESPVRDFRRESPPIVSKLDRAPGDPHPLEFIKNKSSLRFGVDREPVFAGNYENMRLREFASDRRASEEFFERQRTEQTDKMPPWHSLSFERPQRVPPFVDSWDVEDRSFPLTKKLKFDLIPDKDLPEYPFSDLEPEKYDSLQKPFPDLPEHHHHHHHGYNKPLDPFIIKGAHDFSRGLNRPHAEMDDSWGHVGRSGAGSRLLPNSSPKLLRSTPESHKPPPPRDEIWKWEGTIAKGGTPVCRALCFPVGKVLDFMLPEFLNCTARTGLDMLAKHYYQAVSTWVVFFVAESDSDICFYNEFMHYLGEKQRAAVAKLGEKVTLFLVPPSDFSEQVLKVPGKVSISGVILKFQQNTSNFTSLHHPMDLAEQPKAPSLAQRPNEGHKFLESTSFPKPSSPNLRTFLQKPSTFQPSSNRDDGFPSLPPARGDKLHNYDMDGTHDQFQPRSTPFLGSGSGAFISAPSQAFGQSFSKESVNSGSHLTDALATIPAIKFLPQASPATSMSLQPERLAHLAALLGSQKQSGEELPLSLDERAKSLNLPLNSLAPPSYLPLPSAGQQQPDTPSAQIIGQQANSLQEPNSSREETDADPEKRLQATLQLAAALLQQIQQRSKAAD